MIIHFYLEKFMNHLLLLYQKGKPLKQKEDCIAIVGSRITTPYGKKVARNLTGDLVKKGLVIVSGLARGIDSISHTKTVES